MPKFRIEIALHDADDPEAHAPVTASPVMRDAAVAKRVFQHLRNYLPHAVYLAEHFPKGGRD